MKQTKRWIARDLSNGDGADGRKYPTYVWACGTRREARLLKQAHQNAIPRGLAALGPIEQWTERVLRSRYAASAVLHPGLRSHNVFYFRRRT